MLANVGVETEYPETPVTIFSGLVFSSRESEETTGKQIETALQQCLAGNYPEISTEGPSDETTLPIIGKIMG